jgi:hypothetical protein
MIPFSVGVVMGVLLGWGLGWSHMRRLSQALNIANQQRERLAAACKLSSELLGTCATVMGERITKSQVAKELTTIPPSLIN